MKNERRKATIKRDEALIDRLFRQNRTIYLFIIFTK